MIITTLDGPAEYEPTNQLRHEVSQALAFHAAYGRTPRRALPGIRFTYTTSGEFRLIDGGRFWRLTREQALRLFLDLGGEPAVLAIAS